MWSPQSNLRLYGLTTRVADALDVGLLVALGADWLPSGSMSLLAEMKVARAELASQGRPVTAVELVTMVTAGAAQVAGLGAKLGSLEWVGWPTCAEGDPHQAFGVSRVRQPPPPPHRRRTSPDR